MTFESVYTKTGTVNLPAFTGTRVMMLPFVLGEPESLPSFVAQYRRLSGFLARMADPQYAGSICYLTVDEKQVTPGSTHRREGLHVDGGSGRGWGGGGGWGSVETGMLTVSSHPGCRAWMQEFDGEPGEEGSCEHLRPQLWGEGKLFAPRDVYWLSGLCVHESIAQRDAVERQFVRISMPSTCAWFEGYTVNPLGILPTGPILPRRAFMDMP